MNGIGSASIFLAVARLMEALHRQGVPQTLLDEAVRDLTAA
ncbi:hypothetical protein AGMMS50256_37780 [Betaproteobacteria bacterium]|nr:hypothetical protein AGMMS50256_37780 [Betaproteobacteria bacterium]